MNDTSRITLKDFVLILITEIHCCLILCTNTHLVEKKPGRRKFRIFTNENVFTILFVNTVKRLFVLTVPPAAIVLPL